MPAVSADFARVVRMIRTVGYEALHSEGRKAILGRARPNVLELHWPSAVAVCMWFGRGVEEIVAGFVRALRLWRVDVVVHAAWRHLRRSVRLRLLVLFAAASLAWRIRARRRLLMLRS